jgi:hypothetical protein
MFSLPTLNLSDVEFGTKHAKFFQFMNFNFAISIFATVKSMCFNK